MLYDINGKKTTYIPHEDDYQRWMSELSQYELDAVKKALNDYCDTHESFVSGFIPGSNWGGTPFIPLYYACKDNEQHAAWFFGLLLWTVIQSRTDEWYFFRSEASDRGYTGLTYFRKK